MVIAIETLAFLELSDDDTINPDAAVEQMEQIVSILNHLTANEKTEFINFVQKFADSAKTSGAPEKRIQFFRSLPYAIGLVE